MPHFAKILDTYLQEVSRYVREQCNSNGAVAQDHFGIHRCYFSRVNGMISDRENKGVPSKENLKKFILLGDDALREAAQNLMKVRYGEKSNSILIDFEKYRKKRLLEQNKISDITPEGIKAVYYHASLQLHVQDFPLGSLHKALSKNKEINFKKIECAAARDLLFSYITAKYFIAYSDAIEKQIKDQNYCNIPKHPVADIQFCKEMYEEQEPFPIKFSDPSNIASNNIYMDELMIGFNDIIRNGAKNTELLFRHLSEYDIDGLDLFLENIKNEASEFDVGLYNLLGTISDFKKDTYEVPDAILVLAITRTAALRSIFSTLMAANTLSEASYLAINHGASPWFQRFSRKISEFLHYIHIDVLKNTRRSLDDLNQHILTLPESDNSIVLSESLEGLEYDGWATLHALTSHEGLWFTTEVGIAYLNASGSVVQSFDGKIIHRHNEDENNALPEKYDPDLSEMATF